MFKFFFQVFKLVCGYRFGYSWIISSHSSCKLSRFYRFVIFPALILSICVSYFMFIPVFVILLFQLPCLSSIKCSCFCKMDRIN